MLSHLIAKNESGFSKENRKKIKKEHLLKDLRLDVDRVCVEHDALQNRSACIEARHKVLIKRLTDELCRVMFVN